MLTSTRPGRRAADPATTSAVRRSGPPSRRRAARKLPARSSWAAKGALALAVTGALAAVSFPQGDSPAPSEARERAAVTEPAADASDAHVTLADATSSPKSSEPAETENSEVRTASEGSPQELPDGDKPEKQPTDAGDDKSDGEDPEKLKEPLADPMPTSSYGQRVSPITGAPGEFHSGQDFGSSCGTPILSSAGGTVAAAGWHPYGGGNRVVIDHGDGLKTTYNHMATIDVAPGEAVKSGEVVGEVGTTGASTGCHLHFEVVLDGHNVNPMEWI